MNSDRIKEIQQTTAYPESVSVKQALLQVWNECEQEYRSQASELPSDDEIESLSVKRYRGEDLDEQKRNSKLILAFEDGLKQMRSIASPLLSSHVARIKELEEKLSKADVTGMYDVECICSVFGEFKHCKSCYPITNK